MTHGLVWECRLALQVRLADWLGWLEANMNRSIDATRSQEDQSLAICEVAKTAATLRGLSENLELWGTGCD